MTDLNNKIIYSILTLMLFLFFGGIIIVSGDQTPVPVSLQLKWSNQFQFAGYYMAQEKGFYQDAGLNVTLLEGSGEIDPVEKVVYGDADIGIGNSDVAVKRAKGNPIVVLGVIFQHSPFIFLVREDSGISSVHDLEGKTVMIDKSDDELLAYLIIEGIPLDSINFVVESGTGKDELLKGNVDACSAYSTTDPYTLQEKGLKYLTFSPRASGLDFYGDNLFTTEEYLKNNPETIDKFLDASYKGWQYALDNPEEAIDIIIDKYNQNKNRKSLQFEADQINKMIMSDVVQIGYMNSGRWESIIEEYETAKMILQPITTESLLYYPDENKISKEYLLIFFIVLIITVMSLILFLHSHKITWELKTEIEARKVSEKSQIQSENELNQLLNSIPELVLVMDNEGRYLKIAPTNPSLLYRSANDLIGKTVYEFFPFDIAEFFIKNITTAIKTEKEVHCEYALEIDEKKTWFEANISPMSKTKVIFVIWDVTEDKKVADNLLMANKKINMLSSITRHDILNQITALELYLSLCLEDIPTDSKRDYISNCRVLAKVIEAQIMFTKIYENIGNNLPVWQEVSEVVKKAKQDFSPTNRINYHLNLDNIFVYADPLFEKVYSSLIENSLPNGKNVTDIWFTYEIRNSQLVLIYEDNGIGIRDNEKTLIFKCGYEENSGFGLFMAHEILAICNMTINETGTFGKGLHFEIYVPSGFWKRNY